MNFSLKPNPLIAILLPGFTTLVAIIFFKQAESPLVTVIPNIDHTTFDMILIVTFGFVLGNFLDAVRDVLEGLFDMVSPIKWDFFISGPKNYLQNFEEWFYTWYELDLNLVLGTILFFICRWKSIFNQHIGFIIALIIFLIILSVSAVCMRIEVKTQIDRVYDD